MPTVMKNRINSGDCAVVWILFHVGFEPSLFCGKNSDIFLAFSRILYVCMCESTKINRLFYRTVFLPFVLRFSAHSRVISHFFGSGIVWLAIVRFRWLAFHSHFFFAVDVLLSPCLFALCLWRFTTMMFSLSVYIWFGKVFRSHIFFSTYIDFGWNCCHHL